jgi:UDP:flavonoid glycosyltransferase YjiC (YdhE family)
MSYVRTAAELRNRGHEVTWILSPSQKKGYLVRAHEIVEGFGIHAEIFDGLYIGVNQKIEDMVVNTRNLLRYFNSNQYDCVVVDRWCILAAYSAHLADLPWATAGTDGREWTLRKFRILSNPGVFPGSWDASPISAVTRSLSRADFSWMGYKTFWSTSPFLNISFFPRTYYQDHQNLEHPKHSHFVGCGDASEPFANCDYLLVTFGNYFNPLVRLKLIKILRPLFRDLSISVLFLAGNMDVANAIRQTFRHDSSVEIREWMPYDRAYRRAIGVVGHGGTSHIWYGLREAKPLLAVPFMADQFFGGLELERLNIGRTVNTFVLPCHLSRQFRKISRYIPRKASVYLCKRELSHKLHELLTDTTIRDSSIRLSRLMRTGGGVQASASLLEHLAISKEPIATCVTPSCCC